MAQTPLSERANIDDVIRWELYEGYCRAVVTVHNRTGSTVSKADVMGQPLRNDTSVTGDYMFVQSTAESYTTALCLSRRSFAQSTLANAGTFKTKALVRGPAIVDKVWIPAADVLGVAFTIATVVTALQALVPPILVNDEHVTTVTQTT